MRRNLYYIQVKRSNDLYDTKIYGALDCYRITRFSDRHKAVKNGIHGTGSGDNIIFCNLAFQYQRPFGHGTPQVQIALYRFITDATIFHIAYGIDNALIQLGNRQQALIRKAQGKLRNLFII
ncbi:hypothetical protein D3C86_1397260 [compost metagenome]